MITETMDTEEKISVKLEVFEGPLELLLHLLKRNKVSIYDIPIVKITEQYMEYLAMCESFDIELSADFLVMASELLLIKSKMLLPKPQEETEDPRDDLVDRLLKYEKMKRISSFLKEHEFATRYNFFKEPDKIESRAVDYSDQSFDIELLIAAFLDVSDKNARLAPPPQSAFRAISQHEVVPVETRVTFLRNRLKKGKRTKFSAVFEGMTSRTVMIATFLALLEMIKCELVICENDEDKIYITKIKDGETSDGFKY